ncbi:protein of unknown function [Taphrina deformans PYCC 5710]|uniref:Uncharacterized protein n=1 Tax=Taphrina deformans (strain PYCC 5710 / ATCC 11124 / CBS 356.35 / IMI 108563 / JCM 9778 / NBRC 8474) TaxID=1097556 RepID=R4XEL5_TAPDE|nr:protein of unknown function [Taphrina deformans PYCC 5710]|eukprot:CCG82916.1 protein of unknown function [Taphrina deformans PYCC 5710]
MKPATPQKGRVLNIISPRKSKVTSAVNDEPETASDEPDIQDVIVAEPEDVDPEVAQRKKAQEKRRQVEHLISQNYALSTTYDGPPYSEAE